MKIHFSIFFAIFFVVPGLFGQNFTAHIKGSTADTEIKKIKIRYYEGDIEITDSVLLTKHSFSFKKVFKRPTPVKVFTNKKTQSIDLFLENGIYLLTVNTDGIKLLSSPETQNKFAQFAALDKKRIDLFPLYYKLSNGNDSVGLKRLSETFDSINQVSVSLAKHLFKSYSSSALGLFLFQKFASEALDYSDNEQAFNLLPPWAKKSADGKVIKQLIEGGKRTKIGSLAPLFTQKDTSEHVVSLQDYKGKYTLVDFWASWCKPCREENPNLIKMHEKYKDKNFTILGVALEQPKAKASWLKAIRDDVLTWTNVTDFKYFKNEAAILYGVQSIPINFLLDPDGRIIAKNLKGEELDRKLKELLEN